MYFHNTLTFSATQMRVGEMALRYLDQGYSVIPVHGDNKPSNPKSAAITWKVFQSKHPTTEMIHHWFITERHQGIAIITGRISQLAVLDFDSSELFRDFCQQYPDLSQTYCVRTRRGYHLYYHIPKHINTISRRMEGLDWQFEGRYVVAPPTHTYRPENTLNPRVLTQSDVKHLNSYFESHSCKSEVVASPIIKSSNKPNRQDIGTFYRKHAQPGSRNSSLFQTACFARDYGWTQQAVEQVLSPLHQDNALAHESSQQRQREAQATIQSALSRPPRPIVQAATKTLPNSLKEVLFQHGLTCVVRVLEGLTHAGYSGGDTISRPELFRVLLDAGIGHHSIKRVLAENAPDGSPILKKVSPKPPSATDVARATAQTHNNKCYLLSHSKPSKTSKGGRPIHYYQLPTHAELGSMFDVPVSYVTDELPAEVIQSAKTTRQTYHRAFIARRPGQYTSQFLSKRIGISITTKNRYDKAIPDLHKRPSYTEVRILWDSVNEIPDEDVAGHFLQDRTGKRYPAKQGIAYRLLGEGKSLSLMKQGANYYWVGHRFEVQASDLIHRRHSSEMSVEPWRERASAYWEQVYAPTGTESTHNSTKTYQNGVLSVSKDQYPSRHLTTLNSATSPHDPHLPFADAFLESTSQTVQKTINEMDTGEVSLRSVRRLIGLYGRKAVWSVMKRVQARHDVQNPAGLMTVILRSEANTEQLRLSANG